MPGVYRPYTLIDILGTLNQQSSGPTGDTILSLGHFVETDEATTITDTITSTPITGTPAWDTATWGATTWA